MRAFILAGGLGTRLRAAVKYLPKSMAPLGGKPLLEYQLRWLKKAGLSEVVLCTGYLGEMIKAYFGNGGALGLQLYYSKEEMLLGTGGALKNAGLYVDGTSLVLNGDTLITFELPALTSFHRQKGGLATLVLAPAKHPGSYGQVLTDQEARVVAFLNKTDYIHLPVSAGVYLIEPEVLHYIPDSRTVSLELETFPLLIRKGELFAFTVDTTFIDIGTPQTYQLAQQEIKKWAIGY